MTTAKLTKDKIDTYSHANLISIIDNRTYIPDPRGASGRVMVYDHDPFHKGFDFNGFPYIVVECPLYMFSKPSANGKHKDIFFSSTIIIRTTRIGAGNSVDSIGMKNLHAMTDSLVSTFNNETVKAILRALEMRDFNITKDSTESLDFQDNQVFESTFTLEFSTRMEVG